MSHPKRRRTAAERSAAIARLRHEEQVPISVFVGEPVTLGGKVKVPSYDAIHRWGSEGVKGVYLDILRVRRTGELVTSHAALARFVEAVNAAAQVPAAGA